MTSFETGFLNGIEWVEGADGKGEWNKELGELVQDERYVVVDVLNQGLVVFSACSRRLRKFGMTDRQLLLI